MHRSWYHELTNDRLDPSRTRCKPVTKSALRLRPSEQKSGMCLRPETLPFFPFPNLYYRLSFSKKKAKPSWSTPEIFCL